MLSKLALDRPIVGRVLTHYGVRSQPHTATSPYDPAHVNWRKSMASWTGKQGTFSIALPCSVHRCPAACCKHARV